VLRGPSGPSTRLEKPWRGARGQDDSGSIGLINRGAGYSEIQLCHCSMDIYQSSVINGLERSCRMWWREVQGGYGLTASPVVFDPDAPDFA
jgi:hypothetical protein